ncbi:MAG: calcium-binding protein [Rhodospirillaceae bacterium]|nr:calcium-binding protein [Rhodospirillaceae bacterium]
MSDDDGGPGRNSQLIFTADTAGRYYLEAGASGSGTGTYGVSVTDVTDSVLSKGGPAGETIRGSDGADTLYGRSGDDTLEGGAGDDMLRGNAGADTLRGGDGKDTLRGGKGDDTLEGGAGDDSLDGGEGNDALHGDGGDDMLRGRKGDDKLYGGAGADDLRGGVGNDILDGGAGDDRLFGGAGNDKFVFAGSFGTDRIRDFGNGEDLIDLSGLSVTFEDAMSGARQDGRDVRIELEGSGTIVLEGVRLSELDSSDFLF